MSAASAASQDRARLTATSPPAPAPSLPAAASAITHNGLVVPKETSPGLKLYSPRVMMLRAYCTWMNPSSVKPWRSGHIIATSSSAGHSLSFHDAFMRAPR